jgi:xylulokinase
LNHPIYQTQTEEAAAIGAALLAGVGAGIHPDVQTACRRIVRWRDIVFYPIPENVALYDAAYRTYCQLYPALNTVHRTTREILE